MKRFLLLIFLNVVLVSSAWPQLSLTLQVPQAGLLLKPQLWNAVIVNSYPDAKQVYIGLTLSDAVTSNPVITATTTQFTLPSGGFQVQESTVSPITYEYLTSDITDRDPEGYLPVGNYTACYTLFEIQENSGTPVAEQCTSINIEPVSPPILNLPLNEDTLNNFFPQFSWTPPLPTEIFSNLNYDFVLVEVGDGQNPSDAIQQNMPVYNTNLTDLFINYPASALSLDTGKLYAWEIIAKNNDQFAAQSEVWTFSIRDSKSLIFNQSFSSYTKLKRNVDASMSVSVENVLAYYENDADDSTAQYSIYDIDESSQTTEGLPLADSGHVNLVPGINLINLPQQQLQNLKDKNEYLFQLNNSRNEVWSMKFIYYRKKDENSN